MTKTALARWLTVVSVALFVVHFYGFWVIFSTFAAGLVWWMNLLTLVGPPVTLIALVVTLRRRAQPILASLNAVLMVVYAIFWARLIPQLSWDP
jgi:hypothetical protein